MKKLPKIYQNEITKKINNNKTVCYLKEEPLDPYTGIPTILEKIDQVFSGYGYSYNIPVTIKTTTNTYNTSLIAKTEKNIITLDNDIIPISEIIDFQITKK